MPRQFVSSPLSLSPSVVASPNPVSAASPGVVPVPATSGMDADVLRATPIPVNPSVSSPMSTPTRTPQHSAAKQKQQVLVHGVVH